MAILNQDTSDAFRRKDAVEQVNFSNLWPSETAGNGRAVKNNLNSGAAQGKANFIRKCHCQHCGYPSDLDQNDHSGGSLDGNGAGGAISTATYTGTLLNGTTHTEQAGTQTYNKGSGCPLCFSRNSSKEKIDASAGADPWSRLPPLGF